MEFLVRRRNGLAVVSLHGSLHRSREIGYGARVVSLAEEYFVGVVDEMVVWERFEEFYSFKIMVVSAHRRRCSSRPVHGHLLVVAFPESLPERTVGSRVPCIV